MNEVWIVRIDGYAGDAVDPPVNEPGFINIVLSASSAYEAEQKAVSLLKQYGWDVLSVESVDCAESGYSDEIADLVDDVMANPTHIRLSTIHTYPAE